MVLLSRAVTRALGARHTRGESRPRRRRSPRNMTSRNRVERSISRKIPADKLSKPHERPLGFQARFQQKQLQEKEQKLLQLYDQQQQRAHQVAQRGSAGSNSSAGSAHGTAIGNQTGKVRQMFVEKDRRQNNGKGIDKSYPLEPLNGRSKKHSAATASKSVNATTSGRRNVVGTVKRTSVVVSQRDGVLSRESYTSSSRGIYGESIARRESYGHERGDYDDIDENGKIKEQINGHQVAKNDQPYETHEINIDEVIDNEAMERNRMVAKFHPLDIEKRRRFSTEAESEEFPEEAQRDVPDKASEKPSARKFSQSEPPRAERFKNTNTRKSNATTATKKRSEPTIPTGANASTTKHPNADIGSKKSFVFNTKAKKNITPYPSSKSPDNTSESYRQETKSSSLKFLNQIVGSNGNISSAAENGFSTADRKSVSPTYSTTDSKNRHFEDEKPTSSMAPAPRTVSSLSSSVATNRSQGSTNARITARTKSNATPPTPAARLSAQPKSVISNDDSLTTCKICKRRFITERISLHEQICTKTSQKKRKQFDTLTHRVKGTELESFVQKPPKSKNQLKVAKSESPKSNWRRKHEEFINAIRSAKQIQIHLAAGGKLSDLPPPPASDTSDYVQCPHCSRKFNESAAERHIPKCQNMQHNKPNPRAPPRSKR